MSGEHENVYLNRKPSTEKKVRPALTPESDEHQLISLATDLAKRQLLDGTASSQVITHYLKLASSTQKQENEIRELEKELLKAKTDALVSAKNTELLYAEAMASMKVYSGKANKEDIDD